MALLLLVCGGESAQPVAGPAFDGERALRDLVDQVAIGPRPSGSARAEATRVLIRERLAQAGWPVTEHAFTVSRPGGGEVRMANLIATLPGEREERIWLGAHYDTKDLPGVVFVGANDGASGVAVLLETARALGRRPRPFTVELVFFDGEEAFGRNITSRDGLYGSRALARTAAADGRLEQIRALIVVDMVGDRDLALALDLGSAPWLRQLAREVGESVQPGLFEPAQTLRVVDDHTPFADLGVPVLLLIDFRYGGRVTPGPLWHTAGDEVAAVAAVSLNRVGRVLVQTLRRTEQRLLADLRASGDAGR